MELKDVNIIFQCIAGSQLYGTNTKDSDKDVRGVFVAPKETYLGFLHNTEQIENKVDDWVHYELRKFLKLALNANPNIIELLFVPETNEGTHFCVLWEKILEHRDCFLSKKVRHTFSGYAHSQLKRIKGHRGWLLEPPKNKPEREDFGLPKAKAAMTKTQIGAFNALLAVYLEEIRDFHALHEQLSEMEETKNFKAICQELRGLPNEAVKAILPVSDSLLEAVEKEKSYLHAKKNWDKYQQWKDNRNPERAKLEAAHGYDVKHCLHLYRLFYEGKELLETGHITFPRPEAEFLLHIKNGGLKFEEVEEMANTFDDKFRAFVEKSSLPENPNRKKINALCMETILWYF